MSCVRGSKLVIRAAARRAAPLISRSQKKNRKQGRPCRYSGSRAVPPRPSGPKPSMAREWLRSPPRIAQPTPLHSEACASWTSRLQGLFRPSSWRRGERKSGGPKQGCPRIMAILVAKGPGIGHVLRAGDCVRDGEEEGCVCVCVSE
ncbi:hypothetical protein B0T26DRAFT_467678 [Lasiosphaeria miniovina]|uniref:Uncharacterized protein n=1 Tax=Lasiosphaeria miniovina TaxID=1954250 RepID=A0AA40DMH5_9PEZI|nr:uncharacterized protein B0T26DRAFT_467678 [Lasiosphaeria miniovina]KAK0706686.1 hypothetical protein B0T26DRAFT_467678 [Lasiosphaeria miniovina]